MGLETPGYGVAVTSPGLARMGLAPAHHPAAPGAPGGFFGGGFPQAKPLAVGQVGVREAGMSKLPFPVSSAAALAAGLVQSSGSGRKVAFRGEEREIKI